ncbi:hypothetical protein RIF29_17438 [Crotalaria pallida]|uniref:Uncharacterized protein n=1 Tax=Crotalaria pallida TaxID=3830 RepID=A0AAN9FHA9_CROPI
MVSTVKENGSESGYSGCSPYMFGTEGNVLEAHPTIGDASVASFLNVESNSQSLNEAVLDPGTSSFGFLGQITRNFSLLDLTADFSLVCPLSCVRHPSYFLVTENGNFFERGEQDSNIVLAYKYGNFVHFGEHDCNIQVCRVSKDLNCIQAVECLSEASSRCKQLRSSVAYQILLSSFDGVCY